MSIRVLKGSGMLLLLAAVASCGGGSATGTMASLVGNVVQASPSIVFTPANISISPGDKVTWSFGSVGHNVNFDAVAGAPDNIPGTNSNTSVARTFATAGVYPYHCNIHPSMTGTVTVGVSSVVPPPPPPPPPPPGYGNRIGG